MSTSVKLYHNAYETFKRHLGGAISVLFWGLSFVSTSYIMDHGHLSPTEAYIYRFIIAYIVIAIITHKQWLCNNLRDEMLVLLAGMSSGSLYFIAENSALKMTLTANVSLLSSTSPLVTMLLVALIYKSEKAGAGVITGSIIAFLGVVCVIFNSFNFQGEEQAFHINPLGDLIALSAAFLWAIYSLLLKRLNVVYDSMFLTRKTFFYGIITAFPFLLLEPTLQNPVKVLSNWAVTGNLVFLALGASILSFYLWSLTIQKLGAVKANNYMYFQPIVTLIASAIILSEPITFLGVLGLVLIIFGLWFGDYLQAKYTKAR